MTYCNVKNVKLLLEKMLINVSVAVTEDVGYGTIVGGVTAPEAAARGSIGWQRTVQGLATPAHKSDHNFMLTKHDGMRFYFSDLNNIPIQIGNY